MLSRVSSSVRRAAFRPSSLRAATLTARRTYVQPSGADRASIVDVPSTYQEDAFFAPREGIAVSIALPVTMKSDRYLDMLGFKLEVPKREDNVKDKARPIYLDMQVCHNLWDDIRNTEPPTGNDSS